MDGNLPNLPWPRDLYSAVRTATTSPLYGKMKAEDMCACGCKMPHNLAVSKLLVEHTPFGTNRRVVWFRSMSDRNKWEAANG